MTQPSVLLNAALAAAARGWPVFPLRPGDKRPAGHAETRCPRTGRCQSGHLVPEQRATLDPDLIHTAWTTADYNVGIATGPAGLLVVDLDLPKHPDDTPPTEWADLGCRGGLDVFASLCERAGQTMPTATYTVRTRSGGQQLYFTAPQGKTLRSTGGTLGWKVDTRGWGGYVVAAGSTVNDQSYEVIHDAPPLPLPAWLGDLLAAPPAPAPRPLADLASRIRHTDAYATAALRGELEKVHAAREGGRNRAVYFAAYALAKFVAAGGLTEHDVTSELTAAGASIGLPEAECRTAIRSGLTRGTTSRKAAAA
ncbi:bifunctional DNA primase/polymerase [Streptomyces sp. SL13]|uniref:Bifunctional DNA primase/polymerase n=1 Tax=Streptantibioticus silvisoli TaxID=2705255 RepID=A0AA90HAA0_9ACTN|nr:bifunctional DNA primase/polymerase [Streptantibioticus silvisoli]MDI5971870.1 bifunctional DNA primase/polymerase [Streptantibioticus silvisoli]